MQYTASWTWGQIGRRLRNRFHTLTLVSLTLVALLGQQPESSPGWVACPPQIIELAAAHERRPPERGRVGQGVSLQAGWEQMRHTWLQALARSELLAVLWVVSGYGLPGGVIWLPWVEWLVAGVSVAWPWLGRQPEVQLQDGWGLGWLRWGSLLLLSSEVAWQGLERLSASSWSASWDGWLGGNGNWGLMVGCVVHGQEEEKRPVEVSLPRVEVIKIEGGYQIRLAGEFSLRVNAADIFWLRMVILFLRQLEGPEERQGGRATRDGRRPLVPQQQLAQGFGVPQPHISRWEEYWLERDWASLLSLRNCEVLTVELRDTIVDVFARFPWKGQQWVWEHLQRQGVVVTQGQVRQAAQDSGWARFKVTLKRFFVLSAESIRPHDEGVVQELLALVQRLLDKVEAGEGLASEERLDIAHVQEACAEVGLKPLPTPPAVPWALKIRWVLFAAETTAEDGAIRCTYCGSMEVRPKGCKPRLKRYLDENNQWQTAEVYRYRCDNPQCCYGSFTHFPRGLLPYSPYRLEMRLSAMHTSLAR